LKIIFYDLQIQESFCDCFGIYKNLEEGTAAPSEDRNFESDCTGIASCVYGYSCVANFVTKYRIFCLYFEDRNSRSCGPPLRLIGRTCSRSSASPG